MSRSQKPRRPQYFPRMKHRARHRHRPRGWVMEFCWGEPGGDRWIPFAHLVEVSE